ncbi:MULTISPECIES: head GIN domain-containing protein [Croceitalea]|uniref:Head GIN domain-containing protein n=1 Tax=Croceitalea vernalis TaxID=3075599 RepID=A0ABU3BK83_9FLAO|nr:MULTISPECIES: head GIN domain-containing protein [unclassified Croceitalea]MDT0540886.1 head GIN domain-containing protein [Croceitalea sp. P059]MDT0622573.1 head GIN domain-containing protein [Croceitalea sp. P007]
MKKVITLSLVLFTIAASAQWGKRVKGNGKTVTIERSVGEYDAIAVSGWFDVNLVAGNEGELTLKGEENLLEYIKTEVKDGKLVIKTEKGVNLKPSNWNSGIYVTVPVESVDMVALSGSGDIVGETTIKSNDFKTAMSGSGDITLSVEANSIDASMSGSGDINLSGTVQDFEATISGSGDIKAYDLKAANVYAQVSGSADIKVTATEMIKARVSGSGDISYKGNPKKIDTKTSGSGDISSY